MNICGAPWLNLTVHHSGIVVPCCPDVKFLLKLGDITKQSIEEIWNSEKAERLRIQHVKDEFFSM